jgi:uncharacterized protein (DUF58 family)
MSNVAGVALFTAALFLLVVAVMLNSPALFYMSTAMVATILAARWQAWSAVRNLEFRRKSPGLARVGEWVSIDLIATSSRKARRPLIRIFDHLPDGLLNDSLTSSTPIAPANGESVISRYRFKPNRRGIYRWSKLSVIGHDALGIVTMAKDYLANPVELVVLPSPIPVAFEFGQAAGWGASESEHGLSRGVGIEPRGIREYASGDSLRYVHWRSTARTGQLVVKEFETGSNASASFFIQNSSGSEIGKAPRTTTELMCAHLAYIVSRGLRQGVTIEFPGLDSPSKAYSVHEREIEILRLLARVSADAKTTLSEDVRTAQSRLAAGATVYLVHCVADDELPRVVESLVRSGFGVCAVVYDASAFERRRKAPAVRSATDEAYMNRLRFAGASIRVMPLDGLAK